MKFPEIYRSPHPLGYPHKKGDPFGWFTFEYNGKIFAAMADAQTEWEHVSVSSKRTPTWDEMCYVKSLFFEENDCVVQYHPPKSDYVNVAKTCLHLWKFKGDMPRPPKEYV